MAQVWNNKTYDQDWHPIDAWGNRTGEKDWDASNANQSAGGAAPTAPGGGGAGGGQWSGWDNEGDFKTDGTGALQATAPQMNAAALMDQLGPAPKVETAGPMSGFGQSVQGSIQAGLADPSVDVNSPVYQAQVAAFQRNAQRAAERNRESAAARMNAQGTLQSGGFDATVNRINQDQGAQEQDFEAALMQSELAAGRDRQARAQQLGAGLLSQEQQMGLTERLANQSGALQGMGWNNQRDLANFGAQNQRDLAKYAGDLQTGLANQGARLTQRGYNLQRDLGNRDLDLRGTQIGNQNEQFYDQLGQQLGLSTAQLNQQAMLALLGGG